MLFNSPISPEKAHRLIELLALKENDRVLDVGCGTGEFLIRVLEKYQAHGIGVDIDRKSLDIARRISKERNCEERSQFIEIDITKYQADNPFDCGICLASTHAYAMDEPAYATTLTEMGKAINPGGTLLIGESFWIKPPARKYQEFVGEPSGTYRTHRENVELAESLGLRTLYAITSSLDEWDDFEWSHHMKIENNALENPDDPDAIKKRDRGRAWRSAYLEWGRGTLGFGFYLFRNE